MEFRMRVADVTQYLIRWTVSSPSFREEKFLLPRFLTNFGSPSRLPVVNQGTRSTATLRSFLVFVPRFGSRSLLLFSSIRRSWKIFRRWGSLIENGECSKREMNILLSSSRVLISPDRWIVPIDGKEGNILNECIFEYTNKLAFENDSFPISIARNLFKEE